MPLEKSASAANMPERCPRCPRGLRIALAMLLVVYAVAQLYMQTKKAIFSKAAGYRSA